MDQTKLIVYLSIATAALLSFGYKVINKWIDDVSSKLNKIHELESNHELLKKDVNALGTKVDSFIAATTAKLTVIEATQTQTRGLMKKTYIAVKRLNRANDESRES